MRSSTKGCHWMISAMINTASIWRQRQRSWLELSTTARCFCIAAQVSRGHRLWHWRTCACIRRSRIGKTPKAPQSIYSNSVKQHLQTRRQSSWSSNDFSAKTQHFKALIRSSWRVPFRSPQTRIQTNRKLWEVVKHLVHWIKFKELLREVETSSSSHRTRCRKTIMVKRPVRYHLNQGRSSLLIQSDMEADKAM